MNKWILCGVASGLLVCQSPAFGQAQGDDDGLEEIVVLGLAERYGSGLSRAEFVLGKEDIDLRPAGAEITQALTKIPGVQISTGDARGGSFSLELYVRGLTDRQIGLSVDGIPGGDARFNGGSPPNRFVESSNVGAIRVSQSAGEIGSPTLAALGGFIAFETVDPEDEFGGQAGFALGNFNYQRLFLKIDTGELAGGIRSYWSFSDQSNDIYTGPNNRNKNRQHIDAKLSKDFASGSSVDYRFSYNELEDNDFGIVSLGDFNNNPTSDTVNDVFTGNPSIDGTFTGFGGALGGNREDLLTYFNINLVFSDTLDLSLNPYYHELEGESFAYQNDSMTTTSGDPRDQTTVITETVDGNGVPVADMRVTPRNRERSGLTAELRADDIFGFNDIRVGLWVEGDETNEDRNFFRVTDARSGIEFQQSALGYIQYERSLETDTLHYYIQDKMTLLDGLLGVDIGATLHDVDYEWRSPIEFAGANKVNAKTDDVDLKFGTVVHFNDAFEVFGGYSENFAGIFEDSFLGNSAAIDPNGIEPETSENIDIGLRYVTDTFAVSAQWYKIDFSNRLAIIPNAIDVCDPTNPTPGCIPPEDLINGGAPTQLTNQGGVESTGWEITGSLIRDDFSFYATYSNQESEWKESDLPQGIVAGQSVQDIPEHSFFTELMWSPNENFTASLNAKYTGDRIGANIFIPTFCNPFFCFDENGNGVNGGDVLPQQEIEGYWLVGLTASYDLPDVGGLDNLRFQLNVDNLLDETFISAVTGATTTVAEFGVIGGLTPTSAIDRYFIGYPRSVTFSITADF